MAPPQKGRRVAPLCGGKPDWSPAIVARIQRRQARQAEGIVFEPPARAGAASFDQVRLAGYHALQSVFPNVPPKRVVAALAEASSLPTRQRPVAASKTLLLSATAPQSPVVSARQSPLLQLHRSATIASPAAMVMHAPRVVRTETTLRFAPSTVLQSEDGPVPGLVAWLRQLSLDAHVDAARRWTEEQGAAELEELMENAEDFAEALGLRSEELARLRTEGPEIARGLSAPPLPTLVHAVSLPPAPVGRVPSVTVEVPAVASPVSLAPVVLDRTSSTESASAYVPMDRAMSHSDRFCGDPISDRQRRQGNAVYRWCTPPKHRCRVDPVLLRRRIPNAAELSVLADAQRRAVEVVQTKQPDPERSVQAPLESFDAMRTAFLQRHEQAIRKELPLVSLEPAPVSSAVQSRILGAAQKFNSVPNFGYHGTAQKNYSSIFDKGLLVPGSGGVTVVNGAAHGVGIYTAKGGGATLSQGFIPRGDTDMLVVGVLDKKGVDGCAQRETPRFVNGHRQTSKAAGPAATTYINGRKVDHDERGMRLVGDARIFFDQSRVAPLFIARNAKPQPQMLNAKTNSYQAIVSTPLVGATDREPDTEALQRGGARQAVVMRTGERVFFPPEATSGWNEVRVKRRLVSKEQDLQRQSARAEKSAMLET